MLTNNRDRALFELGTRTAFRGSDILRLRIKDVQRLKEGDDLVIRERKTEKRFKAARRVTLNALVARAVSAHVANRLDSGAGPEDWPFVSQSSFKSGSGAALSTMSLTRMWKHWCELAGLDGNFGSHTGRKSLGYLIRVEDGVGIEVLQKFYGHSSPRITSQCTARRNAFARRSPW